MTNDFGGKAAASGVDGGGFGGDGGGFGGSGGGFGGGGGGGGTEKTIFSMTFIELESAVRNILGEEIVSMKMADFLNHIWLFDQSRTTAGSYSLPPSLSDKTVHEVCQAIWNENGGDSIEPGSSSSSYLQSHQSVGDVFLQAGIVWEELNLTELLASENGGGLDGMTGMCDGGADIVVTSNMDNVGNQVQTEEEQKKSKLEQRRKNDRIRREKEKAKKTEREATIEALKETNRALMVENQQLRDQLRGIEELEAYKREMEENVRKFKEEEDMKFQAKKRKIEKHQKKGGNK